MSSRSAVDNLAVVVCGSECDLCGDTGEMTWQQPVPGPDGALRLTQMSHPCVRGCSGWWRLPAAEQGGVVHPGSSPAGNVAQANQPHRTDWFLLPTRRAADPSEDPAQH